MAVIDTLSLENSVARSRTLAYLGQTALKCLEVGELEDRLALVGGPSEAGSSPRQPTSTSISISISKTNPATERS